MSDRTNVKLITQGFRSRSSHRYERGFSSKVMLRVIQTLRAFWHYIGLAIAVSLVVMACSEQSAPPEASFVTEPTTQNSALTIMWDKGYVLEEDEAIEQVIYDWEQDSGTKINLSFYNSGEIAPKTLRASQAGSPPDVLFAAKSLYPVSDWKGKLADVSEVIAPLEDRYAPVALQSAKIYGQGEADQRYYAVPLSLGTTHIYYWKDLLQQAGYRPEDIPTDWDDFWAFWKTVQDRLQAQGSDVYGIGVPYSVGALDTYYVFEQVLEAYNVQMLNEQGQLRVDQPEVRQGIIECLNWYAQLYQEGYVLPNAVDWLDPDNNRSLLDRKVVMAPNPTLSIPAALRNDPDTYFNQLGTLEFPHKANGEPMPHLVMVRQAIAFTDSPNQQGAKDFLAYLAQPDVLNRFLKSAYGRFIPVTTQLQDDPFWLDPKDPHISTVAQTVADGQIRPFNNVLNPAYGVFLEENIWGQVIHEMVVEGISAEQAADEAIAQIQTIFAQWQ